ncbi:MAG: rane protein [Chitinophagaceae bacterium]|nr:rane protein [Chitinophagaceae bacterium]
MTIFPWQKKKEFFKPEEMQSIIDAIRLSERRTSGEVRVFVESRCRYVDAIDRAAEIFFRLEMERTDDRNAVLVYVAMKDRQLAVFGDENIHKKVGNEYWNNTVNKILSSFNRENYAMGLRQCVLDIGEALHYYFPYDNDTDKNELPDDIVFGR